MYLQKLLQRQQLPNLWISHVQNDHTGLNCSILSYYVAKTKRHFIGRNFDNPSDRPHFVVTTDVEGAYRTLGSACYALYHFVSEGINEKGLFIGVSTNALPPEYNEKEPEYPEEPAVQVIHMVRIALETCATVEEAVELFKSVRIWFPFEVNHLLIADEEGETAIVEFDRERKLVTFQRTDPYLIMTNTAFQKGIDYVRKSCFRLRNAEAALKAKGPLRDLDDVREITRIMQITNGPGRTLWTSYFDIRKREMELRVRTEDFLVPYQFTLK